MPARYQILSICTDDTWLKFHVTKMNNIISSYNNNCVYIGTQIYTCLLLIR